MNLPDAEEMLHGQILQNKPVNQKQNHEITRYEFFLWAAEQEQAIPKVGSGTKPLTALIFVSLPFNINSSPEMYYVMITFTLKLHSFQKRTRKSQYLEQQKLYPVTIRVKGIILNQ
uniref:Uncharacterized protein n=1 Tax=Cuerna arida TaxID=1464854 RepID=A0A1B6EM96_9HEMI